MWLRNPVKKWKYTEWPQSNLEHLKDKCTIYILHKYHDVQMFGRFTVWSAVFKIQGCRNSKFTEWPQNNLEQLTVKGTLYKLRLAPVSQFLVRFRSTTCRFWDTMVSKMQTDFEQLTVKFTLYILNTCPRNPNFGPLCSMTSHFRDTRLLKIISVPNDLRLTLDTYPSKVPCSKKKKKEHVRAYGPR